MKTVCHTQLRFERLFGKEVIAQFAGGRMTSDGGALLLREIDRKYEITKSAANCIDDPRNPEKITHDLQTILRQRIFSIACGYEDCNDATTLRSDPTMKTVSGRLAESGEDLASQPTLSRAENFVKKKDLVGLSRMLMELYRTTHPGPRKRIVIDMDATDDPTHGMQQLSMFHGYFGQHMYHPLLVFDGETGFPLAAILRSGNAHASKGALAVIKRIVKKLRKAYPDAAILFRGDAGFAIPGLYRYLEKAKVRYVIGLITNNRLTGMVEDLTEQARIQYEETGEKQRLFTAFRHKADSWKHSRMVTAKVEYTNHGLNRRFVVTTIPGPPKEIYDTIYVQRGEAENRIKELKLDLKADRLSCHRFLANQFRLLLHTFAYCFLWLLRKKLEGTVLGKARMDTLRIRLLKIGGRVKETGRRVWFHFSSSHPYQETFRFAHHALTHPRL